MKRILLLGLCALLGCSIALADEGMWLFNHFPSAKVKAKYGWAPDQAWLDHVRLSSVRFNNGGSGSFVSADGLTFTNHHVGATCLQQISTPEKDFYKIAFYAKTRAEEVKCPDLELNVLQSMEDVTNQVNAAVKPGMPDAEAAQAQRAEMAKLEKDCSTSTGLRCDVVTLYSGGMYQLYRYKKYTDVRLVFAPEFDAAFYGGDPDNFNFPRYDLDIAFFRVYENNQPVHLSNYFRWSKTGVHDNELVFVSGHPGSTGRLNTMAQLEFLRDVGYPLTLQLFPQTIAALKRFSADSAENAREAQDYIFGYENSLKAVTGYQSGLLDKELMAGKQAEESKGRQQVESDPKKKAQYDDPWGQIANAEQQLRSIYLPYRFLEARAGLAGTLAGYARDLLRGAVERPKPNGERLREYRDSALPSLEQRLFSTAPVYKNLEIALLTESLTQAEQHLKDDAAVQKVMNGKTPAQVAKEVVEGTKLDDVAVRKQLWEGGEKAVDASTDPMIALMKQVEPEARQERKTYDDKVEAVTRLAGANIAKLLFAQQGYNTPPDATFTLRLSYGAVKGYVEDGRGTVAPKGAQVPYFTTMGGAFQHSAAHGNKPPYNLPESWLKAKPRLNLNTPLNFAFTADIIGGNSGSPTVNKQGEVVGIIFDGNMQSLPWNFFFEDKIGRAVSVDSRGIIEALRNIYGANALADELVGTATKPTTAAQPKK